MNAQREKDKITIEYLVNVNRNLEDNLIVNLKNEIYELKKENTELKDNWTEIKQYLYYYGEKNSLAVVTLLKMSSLEKQGKPKEIENKNE